MSDDDKFLRSYDAAELRIAAEFLSNWQPFLTRGLCKSCSKSLSDRIRSLDPGDGFVVKTPSIVERGDCIAHASNGSVENVDNGDTHSLGSWKDEADGVSECNGEAGSLNSETLLSYPTVVKAPRAKNSQPLGSWNGDGDAVSEQNGEALCNSEMTGFMTPRTKQSWADMAQEEDDLAAEEEHEVNGTSREGTSSNGVNNKVVVLSREQREYIRFGNVDRKKDFVCLERVGGKLINILDGLELHKGVFSAKEQRRIVSYVEELREMGKQGGLKERTYSAPQKWMKGKGRVTLQFGCCYNYATDRKGNPPGILRDEFVDPLPHLFKVMIKRLVKWHVLPPSCVPNSCIVNIYEEGDCIPPHIDNHDFVRPFCTVSFLSECKILFGSNLRIMGPGEFAGSFAIPLPVGSVLVINGNGADIAKHCVPAVPTQRISITFRKMDESKHPLGYAPEPDLVGLQPMSVEGDRSNNKSDYSRQRHSLGHATPEPGLVRRQPMSVEVDKSNTKSNLSRHGRSPRDPGVDKEERVDTGKEFQRRSPRNTGFDKEERRIDTGKEFQRQSPRNPGSDREERRIDTGKEISGGRSNGRYSGLDREERRDTDKEFSSGGRSNSHYSGYEREERRDTDKGFSSGGRSNGRYSGYAREERRDTDKEFSSGGRSNGRYLGYDREERKDTDNEFSSGGRSSGRYSGLDREERTDTGRGFSSGGRSNGHYSGRSQQRPTVYRQRY